MNYKLTIEKLTLILLRDKKYALHLSTVFVVSGVDFFELL